MQKEADLVARDIRVFATDLPNFGIDKTGKSQKGSDFGRLESKRYSMVPVVIVSSKFIIFSCI